MTAHTIRGTKRTILLVLALAMLLPAVPAQAASCQPAGGQSWSNKASQQVGVFTIAGKGWGHGVGMSQYGAHGAGQLGCNETQILTTYFPGTSIGSRDNTTSDSIRVGLHPNAPSSASGGQPATKITVRNDGGSAITWQLFSAGADPVLDPMQPGDKWTIWMVDNEYRVRDDGDGSSVIKNTPGSRLEADLTNRRLHLASKNNDYGRGTFELNRTSACSDDCSFTVVHRVPSIEEYLYGLAEMPSSFHPEALQAQAIAGRSYALITKAWRSHCRCEIYDSIWHQAYHGLDAENANWKAAVDGTTSKVLTYDGNVVQAFYASSHGGHSESGQFIWGGSTPYLQAVDDSRWESQTNNPYRTWTTELTGKQIGSVFGVGEATSISLPNPKGAQGRIGDPSRGAGGVVIRGTSGQVTVSGNDFRAKLNNKYGYGTIRSTMFTVADPRPTVPEGAVPVVGRWQGGGDQVGWFHDGVWSLRRSDGTSIRFTYGRAGDVPVVGDWDGDGDDTVGIVRNGRWHLKNALGGGTPDWSFTYGRVAEGDIPLTGDWDRDGDDTPGIVRNGRWHLRNKLSGGVADVSFTYGRVLDGDIPLTGDWDADGDDTPGIVRNGRWHLRNKLSGGVADVSFTYGRVLDGDIPVPGDWNDDRLDTPGIVREATWHLRNKLSGGVAQITITYAP